MDLIVSHLFLYDAGVTAMYTSFLRRLKLFEKGKEISEKLYTKDPSYETALALALIYRETGEVIIT